MTGSKDLEKLVEYYHNKKLAHAYLITTNNIPKCLEVLLKVIKNIFCVNNYEDNCNKCSLCHLIDLQNLPSLKIIEPDGEFIKKEQILDLKNTFAKSNQFTNESIYIIKNAEKLNSPSANIMLKFLEEPEGNVIGFFITSEKDNVLPTIQSRCELISANFSEDESSDLTELEYQELSQKVMDYLEDIEVEKKKSILCNNEYLIDLEKSDVKNFLSMALSIYKTTLNNKISGTKDDNPTFLSNLSIKNIQRKMQLIIEILQEINYNVNIELLLDKFVLEMEGINNEVI